MLVSLLDRLIRVVYNTSHGAASRRLQERRNRSRDVPISPSDIDDPGVAIGEVIPPMGKKGPGEQVRLRFSTRLRQSVYFGEPGSGKSTCLRTTILHDIDHGNGIVNLDWQGESTDLLLAYLAQRLSPEELAERLVLIDYRRSSAFGETNEPVVGFNPIHAGGGDPYAKAAQFKNILKQALGDSVLGVQLSHDLEHVSLALALSPNGPYAITDIERVLTDASGFRRTVLRGVTDEVVLRYFEQLSQVKDIQTRVLPLSNKISPFVLGNLRLRASLTNTTNCYSFHEHFARVKNPIVLICVAADEMGDRLAGVAAALLLNDAMNAVMRSDRLVAGEPKNGVHYVLDESPEYAAAIEEQLSRILRIGRKHGAYCSVVAQSPTNLPASIRNLLIDVAATKCFFSQGPAQADHLAGWVSTDAMPKAMVRAALMQAPPGEALLLRPGHAPCRMRAYMTPYPKVDEEKVRALRRAALARWGTPIPAEDDEPDGTRAGAPADFPVPPPVEPSMVEARDAPEPDAKPRRRRKP